LRISEEKLKKNEDSDSPGEDSSSESKVFFNLTLFPFNFI